MKTLVWSSGFTRALRRAIRRHPELRPDVELALRRLADDPFQRSLHSHKLKGDLAGIWACTVDYNNRILFELVANPETGEDEIHLLALGSHDEVY